MQQHHIRREADARELGGEGDGAAAGEQVVELVVGLTAEHVEDPLDPRVGLGADVVVTGSFRPRSPRSRQGIDFWWVWSIQPSCYRARRIGKMVEALRRTGGRYSHRDPGRESRIFSSPATDGGLVRRGLPPALINQCCL